MSCPANGPCLPFVDELSLCCLTTGGAFPDPCLTSGQPVPQTIVDNALMAASEVLWAATGRQYGKCTVTIRPCQSSGNCNPCPDGGEIPFFGTGDFGYGGGFPWYPQMTEAGWVNVRPCGCNKSCGCTPLCEQALPYPTCCIEDVKVNGISLAPALYNVVDFKKLVRLSGDMFVQPLANENPTPSAGGPTSPGSGFILLAPSSTTGMVSDLSPTPTYSWDGFSVNKNLIYSPVNGAAGFSASLTQANDFRILVIGAPGFSLDDTEGGNLATAMGFSPGSTIPSGSTGSIVVSGVTVTFTATGPSNNLVLGGGTGFASRLGDFDGLDAGFTLTFSTPLLNNLVLLLDTAETAPVGITNVQVDPAIITPPNVPIVPVIGPGAAANPLGVEIPTDNTPYDVQLGACRRGVTFDLVYGPGVSGTIDLFGLAGGEWDFSIISGNPLTVSKSGQTLTVGPPQDAGSNVVIRIRLLDPGCITDFIIQKHMPNGSLFLKQVAWIDEATTTNDSCWPECQDLSVDDNHDNTYSITVTYGREVPELIKLATASLACEFIKACANQPCALPQRIQSISRQGITIGLLDPMTFLEQGRTGIYLVDLAINQFNPHKLLKQASVYSLDQGKRWSRVTGRDC